MANSSKTFLKTKQEVQNYFRRKTLGLTHSQRRCIQEVAYGVLHCGDITLSQIARSLNERTRLDKTIERLSQNISKEDFSVHLERTHLNDLSQKIDEKSVIVFDDSDLRKPRAKAMEDLCPIHDGSTGETGKGYWLQYSCLVSPDKSEVKSLLTRVYSSKSPDFLSRNKEREEHLYALMDVLGTKGVYVMDRGFSDARMMRFLLEKQQFVIRSINRNVKINNKSVNLKEWSDRIRLKHAMQISDIEKSGKTVWKDTFFAVKKVEVAEMMLTAVVLKIQGHCACVLLTNQKTDGMHEYDFGKMVIGQYGCRWSVEEKIRFEKQQFNYENIRVRTMTAIRNMMAIINLLASFLAHIYWKPIAARLIEAAQVVKKEVRFQYYRLSEGIKRIFRMRASPPFSFAADYRRYFPRNYQIEFWEL